MVPKNMAKTVLPPAVSKLVHIAFTSPSLKSALNVSIWKSAGNHTGGLEKISSGVLNAIMKIQ